MLKCKNVHRKTSGRITLKHGTLLVPTERELRCQFLNCSNEVQRQLAVQRKSLENAEAKEQLAHRVVLAECGHFLIQSKEFVQQKQHRIFCWADEQ
uniref:Uncharacterized protein n=1 Tax=Globodera pallida TaxID=36090 RepID=A0A183BWM3_GLOPA